METIQIVIPDSHVKELQEAAEKNNIRRPESLARLILIAGLKQIERSGLDDFLKSSLDKRRLYASDVLNKLNDTKLFERVKNEA